TRLCAAISSLFPYTTLFRSWKRGKLVLFQRETARGEYCGLAGGVHDYLRSLWQSEGLSATRNRWQRIRYLLRMLGTIGAKVKRKDRKSTRLNSSHVSISYAV